MAWLLRDLIIGISCLILLLPIIHWIALLAAFCSYLHFRIFSSIQEKSWQESLNRSPKSREINYLATSAINPASAKDIRFFDVGRYIVNTYDVITKEIYRNISNLRLKQIFLSALPLTISVIGNLAAFIYVIHQTLNGMMTIGSIALTLQALVQLHLNISYVGEQSSWIKGHLLFFEKYFEFLKFKEKVFNAGLKPQSSVALPITVEFINVSFNYQNSKKVLKNISFTLKPGEKLAIVGKNGSGKSTLIKLFCGLYAPSSGKILINGTDIKLINNKDWRKNIAPVFQDFYGFNFTIEKNITLSPESVDLVKLKTIIKKVGIHHISKDLNKRLGKAFGGIELSGGQWQKLAIARALYKDSEIYLLDEPTSAFDPIAEHEIYRQFDHICKDKTVIFVTHRLNSIVMADRILLLDDGRLVDEGSHKELMEKSPLYNKMFTMQSENYIKLSTHS